MSAKTKLAIRSFRVIAFDLGWIGRAPALAAAGSPLNPLTGPNRRRPLRLPRTERWIGALFRRLPRHAIQQAER